MKIARLCIALIGFLLAACQPDPEDPDRAFRLDRLLEVDLAMDPADWDLLRYEAPGLDHFLDPACPSGPRPTPYTWYPASARVNQEDYGEIEVRKKGLKGSMNPEKTSLKLKFQKEAQPFGMRRMTLNNSVQDPSFSHECLTYHLFSKAGLAAPRCGLARLTVNGEFIGVYTHIEEVKPPLLERCYEDGSGALFEITMADFSDDILIMFEPKGDTLPDLTRLGQVAQALQADDEQLFEELSRHIDLDEFFTYWAMEAVTAHWDGYAGNRNNSFVYLNPTDDRLHFLPWGTDGSFVPPQDFFGAFIGDADGMPWAVYAHGALPRRLLSHPQGRERYAERMRKLLDEVFDEDELLDMVISIRETVHWEFGYYGKAINDGAVDSLRTFIRNHRQRIQEELDRGLSEWHLPPRPPLCVETIQTFSGVLRTSFGTLDQDILATGDGEAFEASAGQLDLIRGIIGQFEDQAGNMQVLLIMGMGPLPDNRAIFFQLILPAERFIQGSTLTVNYGPVLADAGWVDLGTFEQSPAGFVANGTLTLDQASLATGAQIEITFEAPLAVFKL